MHDGIVNDRLENIVAVSSIDMSEGTALIGNVHFHAVELKVVVCIFLTLAEVLDDERVVCTLDRDGRVVFACAVYKDIRGVESLEAQCVQTVCVNYCVAAVAFCENVCVVAFPSVQRIVSCAAVENIVAVFAIEHIVTRTTKKCVVAIVAANYINTTCSTNHIIVFAA